MINLFKILLVSICVIVICFALTSGFVAITTLFFPSFLRFWPLTVTYSLGGILASSVSFEYAIQLSGQKNAVDKWALILFQFIAGGICFYFISTLAATKWFEMRGLEIVFRAFGAALALGSLLFIGKKNERPR